MFKLTSTTYNTRHYNEIKRYIDSQENVLHVANEKTKFFFDSKIETSYINSNDDIEKVLNNEKTYNLIVVTDIFELTSDIYKFLDVHPKWEGGINGLIQLITLSHINQILKKRLL